MKCGGIYARIKKKQGAHIMTTNAARTFHNVKALIQNEELLHEGMHVIVGLSGGPDSVCLFDLLCRLADDMRLRKRRSTEEPALSFYEKKWRSLSC